MRLDIRLPIGMLFSICGILLVLFGALSSRQLYDRSLNININLWWGAIMLVFGIIMFALGRRGSRHGVTDSVERPARVGSPH